MIKLIKKDQLKAIKQIYNDHKPEGFIEIDDSIYKQLNDALVKQSYVFLTEDSFLIVYPYDNNIALNPWFFNGLPIGQDGSLLKQALAYFQTTDYHRVELIGDKYYLEDKEIPMNYAYDYADMVRTVFQEHEVDGDFVHCKDVDENLLKTMYHRAFSSGDAKFYFYQNDDEKKAFWRMLNYEEALKDPASICIKVEDKIIGFVLAYQQGRKNRHISCMCVDPDYFHMGYGTKLLEQVFHIASLEGDESITLGTETSMKAYDLYKKHGFTVKQVKSYYIQMK